MKKNCTIILLSFLSILCPTLLVAQEEADVVIHHAKVITVDASNTIAEAVAIKDGLILKVGTNQEIQAYIGPTTEVIHMNESTITPGIVDAHSHIMYYGIGEQEYVSLRGSDTRSVEDVVAKIEERVQEVEPGDWIMGDGFFKLERMPTRYDLDPVSPDNPVFLQSLGGHYGSSNSKALEIAGVDASTPDPVGGIIERDSLTGEPTGVLWNHPAMDVVRLHHPPQNEEDLTRDVLWAQEDYMNAGYTSFQDVNVRGVNRVRAFAAAKDSLKIRGYILFTIERTQDADISKENINITQDPWLSLLGDKFLVDGQPPTAYTYEPHIGPSYDLPAWNPDTLKKVVNELHKAGHQLAFHVMGDAAIDLALDAIEEALEETPRENHRHRLEHVFLPTQEAIQRMKELNIVVCIQPSALYTGGDFYKFLFGHERIQRLNPIRSFLDAGVPVALSTDWPTIVLLHPKFTFWSSIVRQTLTGDVISPEQAITIEEALRLHTMGSAYAAFEEDVKGSIEEGKYADMTIWSHDLYSIPTETIPDVYVKGVIVGGTMYQNTSVGIDDILIGTSNENFKVFYNYPNPFNSLTRIVYELETRISTKLNIYNSSGQLVKSLVDQVQLPGKYIITWDGKDNRGNKAPSGNYYFQLVKGDQQVVKQAIRIR